MLRVVLGVWFCAAVAVGATGVLQAASVPPPAFALLLTVLTVGAVWLVPGLRARVQALGVGPLVAFHLIRVGAGINFLVLARQGTLPREFALLAGWGDIAVGVGAFVVLMFCLPAKTSGQRTALMFWNAVGLIDIFSVLGNGLRLFVRQPEIGVPFTHLPLALLPLFVVPIVISTHLWIFAWSARPAEPLPIGPLVPPPEENEIAADETDEAGPGPRP